MDSGRVAMRLARTHSPGKALVVYEISRQVWDVSGE
jgi:hypothetical protein